MDISILTMTLGKTKVRPGLAHTHEVLLTSITPPYRIHTFKIKVPRIHLQTSVEIRMLLHSELPILNATDV